MSQPVFPLEPHGFRAELRAMLRLALPMVVAQLATMAMGVEDTVMVGRVSATALASVALGNVYMFAASCFGMGTLMALDPVVAQAVGARDEMGVTRGLQRGILLAVVLAIPSSLLQLPAAPILRLLHQQPDVVPDAARYAMIQVVGILPFYLFITFRQTLQAMHRMRPIVAVIVLANVTNVAFNWLLVFGHWGFTARGAVGSSWATALSRWVMAAGLLVAGWGELKPRLAHWHSEVFAWQPLRRLVALGAPIGVQFQLEFGVFGIVGVLMGSIGATAIAGHQVALNLASFTFMVPFGVSSAAAVLVGNAVGREDVAEARRAAAAGLVIGLVFMATSTAAMVAAPSWIAQLYTNQEPVVAIAASLIPLAGVFQVFDGLQVVSVGILRGLADTRAPMWINVIGFWLFGLPVSVWLGFRTSLGPRGLWWGLVLGLAAVALILLARVRIRFAGVIRRISIENPATSIAPS